jgi:hypothetical protein
MPRQGFPQLNDYSGAGLLMPLHSRRLPHVEHTSLSRQSRTHVSAPYRAINLRSGRNPCDGRSGAKLLTVEHGERPCYSLPIDVALLIGRLLRLGTHAQPQQRHESIDMVSHPPEEAPQLAVRYRHSACRIVPVNPRRRRGVPSRLASAPVQSFRCAPPQRCATGLVPRHSSESDLLRAHGCP